MVNCFNSRFLLLAGAFFISTACQSQSLLPFSDINDIEKDSSVLSAFPCSELIEKATDKTFPLRNLAALRTLARCKDFSFDLAQLTDFERKLYSQEIVNIDSAKIDNKFSADLTVIEIKSKIKKEIVATNKFKLYKLLRSKQRRNVNRNDYVKTSMAMYKWAFENYKKNRKDTKKDNPAPTILLEAAQIAVKTNWTEGRAKAAIKIINETKTQIKDRSIAELLFLKGRIFEESKDSLAAVEQYDLVIKDVEKYSPKFLSFSMDRIMWVKGWILYKEKNYIESEKAFANLAAVTTDLSEKSKALFYQARSLKYLEQPSLADVIFESITQNDFFGYYGLVSYRELGRKFPAIKDIKRTGVFSYDVELKLVPEIERDIFTSLIKFREFNLTEKAVGLIAKTKEDEVNLSLNLAKNNKIYMPLFRAFGKLDNGEKMDVFLSYPELLFPQPYQDQVNEMATKTKIPSSLIYSIIKQESAFNEKARSPADAMGLMQVMPKLAKQLSKKFEVPYKTTHDLFDPLINIQLGCFVFLEQITKQHGQLTYVAAAYNAGPGALSGWLKNRNRSDILEFIEEIPYDETRTYVKLIARNKLFYERISNRDTEHDFPLNFLN